jgi:hypothetical protein
MRHTLSLIVVAAVMLFPIAARAQSDTTSPEAVHRQTLTTNPFGEIVQWFNVEYERTIGPATTLGVAASTLAAMDYTSTSLLLHWYPQQTPLDGIYLGARTGLYRFGTSRSGATVLPGIGLEIGHNWLFGPTQNVTVGLGFGMTRMLGRGAGGDAAPTVLPNARVNVGIAF